MTAFTRILVDISYTRTQTGNVGITRTVRRLLAELATVAGDREMAAAVVPVAYHSTGFRTADAPGPSGHPAQSGAKSDSSRGLAARLWRFVHAPGPRRLAMKLLPESLLHSLWSLQGGWTFDRLTARGEPIAFRAGDLLLLPDESWNYPVAAAAARARRDGARVALVLYDLIPIRQPRFCAPLFTRVFEQWLRALLPHCDGVMCISRATQADLQAWGAQAGVRVPPTSHFRLGSDLPAAAAAGPVRESVVRMLDGTSACFIAVGTIEPRKNQGQLLDAFDTVWAQGRDVRLLVAGRPHADSHEVVARMAAHREQGGRLLTLFDASDAEIGLAYERCRALVFPTLAEGFGLPLVEARTRGCPVIATRLPALEEWADAGVFLFDPAVPSALAALVNRLATQDVRAATAPMPRFTWRDSAGEFRTRLWQLFTPTRDGGAGHDGRGQALGL